MSKCSCETKEHIQIGYRIIGYGRITQTVVDLENAEIKHYYSHHCEQNTVDIMKILFCPFCGKKLKGGAENDDRIL